MRRHSERPWLVSLDIRLIGPPVAQLRHVADNRCTLGLAQNSVHDSAAHVTDSFQRPPKVHVCRQESLWLLPSTSTSHLHLYRHCPIVPRKNGAPMNVESSPLST